MENSDKPDKQAMFTYSHTDRQLREMPTMEKPESFDDWNDADNVRILTEAELYTCGEYSKQLHFLRTYHADWNPEDDGLKFEEGDFKVQYQVKGLSGWLDSAEFPAEFISPVRRIIAIKTQPADAGEDQQDELTQCKNLLVKYEQWEADIISNDEMWWPNKAKDSLPDKIYNTMLELQAERNKLLKRFTPESYGRLSADKEPTIDRISVQQAKELHRYKEALEKAVDIIKQWHIMPMATAKNMPEEIGERMWNIYYNQAPEMKPIREALKQKQP